MARTREEVRKEYLEGARTRVNAAVKRKEVRKEYLEGTGARMDEAVQGGAVVGYAPGVPGARTEAERKQQMRAGQRVSAYTGKPGEYLGGSHKVGGVELVPGAPGYDEAKALPLLKSYVAPYDKSVQNYLKDIGQLDEETQMAIEKVQRQDEYRTGLAQMVSSGELTGPRAEAAMIDYSRGQPRADIETAVSEAQKERADSMQQERAELSQRENDLAAQEASRRRARMRRSRPLLSEERLAPELQL